MKQALGILTAFYILISTACGSSPDSLWLQANKAYDQKKYDDAIESYKEILGLGYNKAAVHFNLANAYYRKREIGPAVLHYKKAGKLGYESEDVEHNLSVCREILVDDIETKDQFFITRWWNGIALSIPLWLWGLTGILGSTLFAISLLWAYRQIRVRAFFTGIIALVILGLSLSLGYTHHNIRFKKQEAVLVADNAYVQSEPNENSTELFMLHEGVSFEVLEKKGDWLQIELPDGREGWIKESAVSSV